MSLLRNSLKEIIRFVHNNVLENRGKSILSHFNRKSDKNHNQKTEQCLIENQAQIHHFEADRPPLPSVWKGYRSN